MRFHKFVFTLLVLSLPLICAEGKGKVNEEEESKREVALTDTTEIAGEYEVNYYSNTTVTKDKSVFLKCGESDKFTLTIPSGPDGTIKREVSKLKDEKDPMYQTNLGDWVVKEYKKAKDHNILKIGLPINNSEDELKIVCWLTKFNSKTKTLEVNINPLKNTECNDKFVDKSDSCSLERAFLVAKCTAGPCNGEAPAKEKDSKDDKDGKGKSNSNAYSFESPAFLLASLLAYNML